MWKGKVSKYQKLLRVKDENGGTIPPDCTANSAACKRRVAKPA